LFIIRFGVSFGYHRSYDENYLAFEVVKPTGDYDALIPTWYSENHLARELTTSHLHFLHCGQQCDGHGKIHTEFFITYDKRVALKLDAIHIGS